MLLDILNEFIMEVPVKGSKNKKLTATFRDLTSKETKALEKKHSKIDTRIKEKQSKIKRLKRESKRLFIAENKADWENYEKHLTQCETIEDEVEQFNADFDERKEISDVLKNRFDLCLGGKDADEITGLAEEHGYEKVYSTILASIEEAKSDRLEKLKNG